MVASLKVLSAFLLGIFLPCMVWASGQDYASATEDKNLNKKEERRQPILSPPGVPLGPIMPTRQQFSIETEAKPKKACCPVHGSAAHSE